MLYFHKHFLFSGNSSATLFILLSDLERGYDRVCYRIAFYTHGDDTVYYLIILAVPLPRRAQQVELVVYLLEEIYGGALLFTLSLPAVTQAANEVLPIQCLR